MSKTKQIENYIIAKIKENEYQEGNRLPTEAELIDQFNVSRMTVNKALNILKSKGYIYSIRGKGTFVKQKALNKKLNELTSFTEEMKNRGIIPITKTIEIAYTSIGYEEEKKSLNLKKEDKIYKLVRVRYNEQKPIALDITFLNEKLIGKIDFSTMGSSLYEYLQKDLGVDIDYSIQKIRAIAADEFLAAHLEICVGEPVLKISSVTYNGDKLPFELVHTYYVHDIYEFEQVCKRSR
ncbi:MAG: GntR family transcriptional regulator [Firmicutes bacterium]|nr:GntR family transcriptional regulator [Bacillota bacterium]